MGVMTRWFFAAMVLCTSSLATACPLCLGAFRSTAAQRLVELPHAVLAQHTADGNNYRVVAVIKGDRPAAGTIPADAIELDFVADPTAIYSSFATTLGRYGSASAPSPWTTRVGFVRSRRGSARRK